MTHFQTHSRGRWWFAWAVVAAVGIAVIAANPAKADDDEAIQQAKNLSRAFRQASKRVRPTVVKVKTTTDARINGRRSAVPNPFSGTPFEDLFDDDFVPGVPSQRSRRMEGLGSGVIIDPEGLVLTSNHVVEDADEVIIQLADGREFKAVDVKADPQSDVAVVRIKSPQPLPAAKLGDSDKLEIGDWVLAVGNPFELDLSVSAGIISGKERSLGSIPRARFLQTDAAINVGNSGGPLVDLDGAVVGINTAILSRSGGNLGIGFAIPINLAKWIIPQLVEHGSVQRAYLGIVMNEVDSEQARKLGLRPREGTKVVKVQKDSPADAAGLLQDDVILSFSGQTIRSGSDLQQLVERAKLGSEQEVKVIRDGEPMTLSVVVKPMPKDFGAAMIASGDGDGTTNLYQSHELGLTLVDMDAELARRLGYDGPAGVLIARVTPDGIASQAGLSMGMVILRVGNRLVKSVVEFRAAMGGESLRRGVRLQVRTARGDRTILMRQS